MPFERSRSLRHSCNSGTPSSGEPDQNVFARARPGRLIFKPELQQRIGLSFTTIWKMMRQNEFPRARKIGAKSAWLESEIDAYIAALPLRGYKNDHR